MYFYKKNRKVVLDLRGDLTLSHNENLVMAKYPGAAPHYVRNGKYIPNIPGLSFWGKVKATFAAINFIWSKQARVPFVVKDVEQECEEVVDRGKS